MSGSCFEIASGTWAVHLLKLNHMRTEQCHRAAGKKFPPLFGRERRKFLRTGTTFLVVRDPFERLVSAFLDKLAKLNPDPSIQPKRRQIDLYIKNKFRTEAREGIIPTFEEFVKYVVGTTTDRGGFV